MSENDLVRGGNEKRINRWHITAAHKHGWGGLEDIAKEKNRKVTEINPTFSTIMYDSIQSKDNGRQCTPAKSMVFSLQIWNSIRLHAFHSSLTHWTNLKVNQINIL